MTQTAAPTGSIPVPPHFPVKWDHPDQARTFWEQERMHFPEPVSELMESLEIKVLYEGIGKGIAQYKMPINFVAKPFNRYLYQSIYPKSTDPAVLERMGKEAEGALQPAIMGLAKTWSEQILPELERNRETYHALDLAKMSDAQLAEHLQWVVECRAREWHLHFVIAFPMILGLGLFEHVYHQKIGRAHV